MEYKVDPARAVAQLRELHALTGDEGGAQRVCWTETWDRARRWFADQLVGLPVSRTVDEAGNVWVTLEGQSKETVAMGSHLDSVPGGGWLDGALGVLAGLEVLRGIAAEGTPPPLTVKLVDWADEEGARFGYDMIGSGAAAGTFDIEVASGLSDRGGRALPDVLREHGVELSRMLKARSSIADVSAYVELHIEQGPVLERLGLPLAAVVGTYGVERHSVHFTGEASHAGSTPMEDRHDAFAAAARLALSVREPARELGGVATVGQCTVEPGLATAVTSDAEITIDLRHIDPAVLARRLQLAREASERIASEERVRAQWTWVWGIAPAAFDPELVDIAEHAVERLTGVRHRMASGPLHDAAEIARAGVPTVMLFVQSLRGLSHNREENTTDEHLELSVRALAGTVEEILERRASA